MASRKQPAAGPGARDERADIGSSDQTTTNAAGGDAVEGIDGAARAADTSDAPLAASGENASAPPAGLQLVGDRGAELQMTGGPALQPSGASADDGVPLAAPPVAVRSDEDVYAAVRARAAEEAARERARRYRDIPVEGEPIDPRQMDALAVHLDLDPGTVIAARQYPDRLVTVTRDGRKLVKDMG